MVQNEGYVCNVADALEADDKVLINARSRPITVLGRELETHPGVIESSFYPARIVGLRGNGTQYRLRYSHTGEYYPRLTTESQRKTRESFSIKRQEVR